MHTVCSVGVSFSFFFFNDTATTEIYTLSLHDALPISLAEYVGELSVSHHAPHGYATHNLEDALAVARRVDRKSTRLNSSHDQISYAVFCLKKKKKTSLKKALHHHGWRGTVPTW